MTMVSLATPTSMEGTWRESTDRLLDLQRTPIGSITSLQWSLTETLVLYWSSYHGGPPPSSPQNPRSRRKQPRGGDAAEKWFRAATKGNQESLRLLDRLAKETIAASTAVSEEEDQALHASSDVDNNDFRTIHVSLIHAVLKQWKECLRWANNNHRHRNNSNTRIPQQQQHRHNQQQQQYRNRNHDARGDSSVPTTSDILLPSELLQTLDGWTSPTTLLFEPNIATYTILMDGAVSCRNYKERVTFTEELLDRLLRESSGDATDRLRPTVVTIGTVIHALANSRTKASAEQAEALLRRIPTLYRGEESSSSETPLRPNTVVYTTVIRAWADVGFADRAEGLLREMCQDYVGGSEASNEEGNPDAKPSRWTFNTVLSAWSRSRDPSSVIQAEGLIRTMKALSGTSGKEEDDNGTSVNRNSFLKLDVSPTIVGYNSLMSTIASRSTQPDSLAKAESWMEEILVNAAAAKATNAKRPTQSPTNRRQHHGRNNKTGRVSDDSMVPNLITFKALFNIIASAGSLSNTEKADRMRYWLARGTSTSLSPGIAGPGNDKGQEPKRSSNSVDLAENPVLLEQIDRMEQRGKKE